ncbi:hypothetical protein DFP72DRAFT_840961 [Ephemerocybe angulata]|uniref:Thioredoxin domain-containing protein n=1 Tax=Ephemerocybe angulata TaxID=980116 RepID=A0A8H6IG80_9AGAR|nr:hypothetical protein DFP72DRAFT_840961 [Tulosesus angulatus]
MSSSSYLRSAARRLSSAIPHARTIHMTAPRAALHSKRLPGTPGRLVLVDFHAEYVDNYLLIVYWKATVKYRCLVWLSVDASVTYTYLSTRHFSRSQESWPLSPVLEALTAEPNKSGSGLPIDLVKIDTDSDDGYQLCTQFEVKAMPTVIAFKDGVLVSKFTGALPPPRVKKFIDEL